MKNLKLILVCCILCLVNPLTYACTRIFWNDNKQAKVFARTMDLCISDNPELLVLPEGMIRNGGTKNNALHWTSKYGSVVLTAFNTDTVSDGMNEKGLAAHLLYLTPTRYAKRDEKLPGLANTLWIQYILDNFATVSQALKDIHDYQVVSAKILGKNWPLHLAMEDASGDSAVVEILDGQMKIYHGHQYTVMTNEPPLNVQLSTLKQYKLFGGSLPLPGDMDPISRFVRASSFLKTLPQPKTSLGAVAGVYAAIKPEMAPFGVKDTSTRGRIVESHNEVQYADCSNSFADAGFTHWVSLGDLTHRIYYFQSTSAPSFIWLDLNHLNFKKGSPVLGVNPENIELGGNVVKDLKVIKQ